MAGYSRDIAGIVGDTTTAPASQMVVISRSSSRCDTPGLANPALRSQTAVAATHPIDVFLWVFLVFVVVGVLVSADPDLSAEWSGRFAGALPGGAC